MSALLEQVDEQVLVSAHTQAQFDRRVVGIRSINPGSVGMPYQGAAGASWTLLGPDAGLRPTKYDVGAAVVANRASGIRWPRHRRVADEAPRRQRQSPAPRG
jgi:hypothetical protein